MKKTIIKCINCGFKYYDGDVHLCEAVSVKEKPASSAEASAAKKVKKMIIKTQKDSFKIWKDS